MGTESSDWLRDNTVLAKHLEATETEIRRYSNIKTIEFIIYGVKRQFELGILLGISKSFNFVSWGRVHYISTMYASWL